MKLWRGRSFLVAWQGQTAVLGDAEVERCGAVCHEIPLTLILRKKEGSRFLVTGTPQNGNKLAEPHSWL